ncbi:MAG: hypothetical protein ACJ77S_13190, partial [Gemmatimonadaceae bacterium]
ELPQARLLFIALTAVACVNDPVKWGDVGYRRSQLGDPDARSAIMDANLPAIAGTARPCIRSIRTAGSAHEIFRAWWSSRSDSSVILSLQRSGNQATNWGFPSSSPIIVDARDRGRRGCDRPAPGIFYDSVSMYLHLVYFIEAADGAGVFFAHSLDSAAMFHSPVPVVYGNSPSVAAVAGHGDSVVVVYEDPNSTTPRIGIVLSHATGHIFDQRGQVTPDEVPALRPWVALHGDSITVWWRVPDLRGAAGDRVGYRVGVWR